MPSADRPTFSVLITAFNRARLAERCVRSCIAQTWTDFEIVLVDDASTDRTVAVLEELEESRLRIVRHASNGGYFAARATAVDNARGEWVVMVDSDDELLPHALGRLAELIDGLPADVGIVRFRHRLDDGRLVPGVVPDGITDYEGRLDWLDAVTVARVGTDAGHCMRRTVVAAHNYFRDRRGVVEPLWELDLARISRSLWVEDVLGLVHADASDRHSVGASVRHVVPRLIDEAPDQLWMAERMLAVHGPALTDRAPHYRRWLLEDAAVRAFLTGDRAAGLRYARAALAAGTGRGKLLATLALGSLGARPLAHVKVAGRGWRARVQAVAARRRGAEA